MMIRRAVNDSGKVLMPVWNSSVEATRTMMRMTDKELTGSYWDIEIERDKVLERNVYVIKKFIGGA